MGAAYFQELQQTVIFGGLKLSAYYDDTFVWDGINWRTRTFDPRPAGRCCLAMVYDSVLNGLLLFGGSVSFIENDETWLFR